MSDVFVLSSDYEGLSLAILEAMAAKLPVVATTVGGNPQIVENGVTGYLVPPQSAERLSDAMAMIMSDRIKATDMGNAGRERIEKKYEIKAITQQTLKLFDVCRTTVEDA
jgi:glycosyltransferase involved in cell wall biosynthesis